uniref:Uncharacterized protein n=1 Tax=Mustela putorius furo TaxID=9669 RepID=M3YVW3_MUSPF
MRLGSPRPQNARTSEPRLPTRRPRHIRVLSRPRPTDQSALRAPATRPPLACRRAPAPSELPPALPDKPPEEIAAAETFLSFTRVCSLALSPARVGLTAPRGLRSQQAGCALVPLARGPVSTGWNLTWATLSSDVYRSPDPALVGR